MIWKRTDSRVDRLVSTANSLDSRAINPDSTAKTVRLARAVNRAGSPDRKRAGRVTIKKMKKRMRIWIASDAPRSQAS